MEQFRNIKNDELEISNEFLEKFNSNLKNILINNIIPLFKFGNFTGKIKGGTQEGYYKNGQREGNWVIFYPYHAFYGDDPTTKHVFLEISYKDGKANGKFIQYYKSGTLEKTGFFKNGLEDGKWVYYAPYGEKIMEGFMKNGFKDGVWVWYESDGKVIDKKVIFKDGIYVKTIKPKNKK